VFRVQCSVLYCRCLIHFPHNATQYLPKTCHLQQTYNNFFWVFLLLFLTILIKVTYNKSVNEAGLLCLLAQVLYKKIVTVKKKELWNTIYPLHMFKLTFKIVYHKFNFYRRSSFSSRQLVFLLKYIQWNLNTILMFWLLGPT
jgi:hypothetical protein